MKSNLVLESHPPGQVYVCVCGCVHDCVHKWTHLFWPMLVCTQRYAFPEGAEEAEVTRVLPLFCRLAHRQMPFLKSRKMSWERYCYVVKAKISDKFRALPCSPFNSANLKFCWLAWGESALQKPSDRMHRWMKNGMKWREKFGLCKRNLTTDAVSFKSTCTQ